VCEDPEDSDDTFSHGEGRPFLLASGFVDRATIRLAYSGGVANNQHRLLSFQGPSESSLLSWFRVARSINTACDRWPFRNEQTLRRRFRTAPNLILRGAGRVGNREVRAGLLRLISLEVGPSFGYLFPEPHPSCISEICRSGTNMWMCGASEYPCSMVRQSVAETKQSAMAMAVYEAQMVRHFAHIPFIIINWRESTGTSGPKSLGQALGVVENRHVVASGSHVFQLGQTWARNQTKVTADLITPHEQS